MAMKTNRRPARPELASAPPLVIGLADPGMTPLLRAGLGGLAASLRAALIEKDRDESWPKPVDLGGGRFEVEPRRITIDWAATRPEKVLEALFRHSLRLTSKGLIDLPGTYDASLPPTTELAAALQVALQRTFLQHGKTRGKAGPPKTVTFSIDEHVLTTTYQPYAWYAHQRAWADVARGLIEPVSLAGWVYPGAAQRHVQFTQTRQEYRAGDALCALFGVVGTVSVDVPRGGGGALVIPEPTDLVAFAEARHKMTPGTVAEIHVGGIGDAVLAASVALRLDAVARHRTAVRSAHGVLLRGTPWGGKQKYRTGIVSLTSFADAVLDEYDSVARMLPTQLHARAPKEGRGGGYFAAPSALRGFIAENLATGRRWHADFATARTAEKPPRFIHYYWHWDKKGLGALRAEEKKGLIAMLEYLDAAEKALVRSVHVALRQRFGAIAEETKNNPATMRNRFQSERDRWRFAFAGSKTPEQIRSALANLWSRAGSNRELQESWETVLPLLRAKHWQAARDLALVALASYQGAGAGANDENVD